MRVALAIQHDWLAPGGAERHARALALGLASRLGGCDLVTSRHRRELASFESSEGMTVRRLPCLRIARLRRVANGLVALAWFARNGFRYDVVYAQCLSLFSLGAVLGARLWRRTALLKVCTVGAAGDVAKVRGAFAGSFLWWLFRRADGFLAGSDEQAEELVRSGVPRARIAKLPHLSTASLVSGRVEAAAAMGPRTQAERAASRLSLGLPERLTFLFVGRLAVGKGLEDLQAAFEVVQSRTDSTLVIVGDGSEAERAREWTRGKSWAERVHWAGWQRDPVPYFAAADVFVFPSHSEAFGNVLLEAMMSGLAIVTTPVGLARDRIRDGDAGLLVPVGDVSSLAESMLRLAANSQLRQELGERAFEVGRSMSDSESVVAAYVECFDRLSTSDRLGSRRTLATEG